MAGLYCQKPPICSFANPAGDQKCQCSAMTRRRYLGKLTGPLMDRIDIQVKLASVGAAQLLTTAARAESSARVAARVRLARAAAAGRWSAEGWRLNAEVPGPRLRRPPWRLPAGATSALHTGLERGSLSARGFDRILRIAWTIADLDGRDRPGRSDVDEAAQLRMGEAYDRPRL